jgi:hypothetical protein
LDAALFSRVQPTLNNDAAKSRLTIERDIRVLRFAQVAFSSLVPPPRANSPTEGAAAGAGSERRFTERRERRYSFAMLRLVWCALLVGCAPRAGRPPATGVRAWLQAEARDDPRAAYRTLSRELRRSLPEAQFATRWRALAEERHGQAAALRALGDRPPTTRAHGLWRDSSEVTLVREPGGWRLAAARITTAGAPSPEDAVLRFTEALERHDLDGLLDLMADPLRSQVERELLDRLQRLKASLHKEIQVNDNKARLRFDDRYYLDLVRENGRWRVSDFN